MIIRYKKGSDTQISNNFQAKEMDCPCSECGETLIDSMLVSLLQAIRNQVLKSVKITSGFRCEAHQAALEAQGYPTAKNSQHLTGCAADIKIAGMTGDEIEKVARRAGFKSVGVAADWIHADIRSGHRSWRY